MLNVGPLADRAFGQYPLSIATSLALEGAQGNHPDHPTGKNELPNYDEIWINLKTIFRNLYNAVNRDDVKFVRPSDFTDTFAVELDQFERIVQSESMGRMRVVRYVCDYAGMEREYPHAILRGDSTPLQKAYTSAMISTLTPYIREHREDIKTYKLKITDTVESKVLLLTHFPLDLTTRYLRRMSLLESHTGAVKLKHQWYTKYSNGKDLPMIPFMEAFLQVFGDAEHFRPMGIGVRKKIIEIALEYKWSQLSTLEKVKYGLNQMKDKFLKDQIMMLFH